MRGFKRGIKLGKWIGIGAITGLTGLALYTNPNVRENPSQLLGAMFRILRCGFYGSMVVFSYSKEISPATHKINAERMKKCFLANRGVYIKVGQIISQLSFLVPQEYVEVMETLCQSCPQSALSSVRKTIRDDLGAEIEDIFTEFEMEPIASASLAQVHRATTKEGGERVAVKVQHEWVRENCMGDVRLIQLCIKIGEWFFPHFKYEWLGNEIKRDTPKELNFVEEASNCDLLRKGFEDDNSVIVPKIYSKQSSPRVLTMSFEEGISITNIPEIVKMGIDLGDLTRLVTNFICKQIFQTGIVHCDPHSGNLFVRIMKNKRGEIKPQLVVLDHGLYEILEDEFRLEYAGFWRAVFYQDRYAMKAHCLAMGTDMYKLFTSMMLNRKYKDVISSDKKYKLKSRLGVPKSELKKAEVRRLSIDYFQEITVVLGTIRRELLLLFKTIEFMKNLEQRFGDPINSYATIYHYSNIALAKQKQRKESITKKLSNKLKHWRICIYFQILGIYYWLLSLFSKTIDILENADNYIYQFRFIYSYLIVIFHIKYYLYICIYFSIYILNNKLTKDNIAFVII